MQPPQTLVDAQTGFIKVDDRRVLNRVLNPDFYRR
jgi:hypothetical protein